MVTNTPLLALIDMEAGQALPETRFNETVRWLEAAGGGRMIVKERDLGAPPAVVEGEAYLVPAAGTSGAWVGKEGKLALGINGAWSYATARDGFTIEVLEEDAAFTLRGGTWVAETGTLDGLSDVDTTGVSDGDILTYDSGLGWIAAAPSGGGGGGGDLGALHVYDEKPAGTAGGGATLNTWHKRDLNTTSHNSIAGASVSSNQITLPAGTYDVIAQAPVYSTGANAGSIRLYNETDATVILLGETNFGVNERRLTVKGRFTLAVSKSVSVYTISGQTVATNGLGVNSGLTGVANHFTDVLIRRVS